VISPDPAPVPAVDAQARSSIAVLEQALRDLVVRLDALRDEVRTSSRGLSFTVAGAVLADIIARLLGK
jgi:hypothetical protein